MNTATAQANQTTTAAQSYRAIAIKPIISNQEIFDFLIFTHLTMPLNRTGIYSVTIQDQEDGHTENFIIVGDNESVKQQINRLRSEGFEVDSITSLNELPKEPEYSYSESGEF